MHTKSTFLLPGYRSPVGRILGIAAVGIGILMLESGAAGAQTVAHWLGGSGNWSDPAKWDLGVVPNNGGGTNYIPVIEDSAAEAEIALTEAVTINGLENSESVSVQAGGTLNVSGDVTNSGTISAAGGKVVLNGITVDGGTLRVTDNSASLVRFSGDMTLNGVVWEDLGAGEFQVYNTTTRFLGDNADGFPAGTHLVVVGSGTHTVSQLIFAGGDFTNEGIIEMRHGGAGWQGYPTLHWEASGNLAGNGEILMSGAGDNNRWTGVEGVMVTIKAGQWIHGRGEITVEVVNEGTVEADIDGRNLTINGHLENTSTGSLRSSNAGRLVLAGGLDDSGTVEIASGGRGITLKGDSTIGSDLAAPENSSLNVEDANLSMNTHTLVAQGGTLFLRNSTLSNGLLQCSDHASSHVRFSGDMTLTGVPWDDLGEGEFQIYNTDTRFLGDYVSGLPAGYKLIIVGSGTHTPARLILSGGDFNNEGMIELRHGGGGWQGYPTLHWETDGSLTGNGEVFLSGLGDNALWTGPENVRITIGTDQWVHGRGEIQLDVLNQGTMEADLADKTLKITGPVENAATGMLRSVNGGRLVLTKGLSNAGIFEVSEGRGITLNGLIDTSQDFTATAGSTVGLEDATLNLNGHNLVADGGTVVVRNTIVNNGTLRASDHPDSHVRFSGDVTLNGIPWEDLGEGEFQIFNTDVRFLGDYADQLPGGYHLVIVGASTHTPPRLIFAGGEYTNNGWIELRHGGGGWQGYPTLHWEASGLLAGSGEIYMSGLGDNALWTGAEDAVVTIGPDQWVHGRGEIRVEAVNQGIVESDLAGKELKFTQAVENTETGSLSSVLGGRMRFAGDLTDAGVVEILDAGQLTFNGPLSMAGDYTAPIDSVIRMESAAVTMNSHAMVADGGLVVVQNSTLHDGILRATDNPASLVRFQGEITLNDVTWDDPGTGEFQIVNADTRFLGDYADQLPSGYRLIIQATSTHTPSRLLLSGDTFTNNGTIEMRHGGGGWQGYPTLHWEAPGTLAGTGEVFMSGGGDNANWTSVAGADVTIGPDQRVHGRGQFHMNLLVQGILEADIPSRNIRVLGSVRNEGTLLAHEGSQIIIDGDLINNALLQIPGGKIETQGSLVLESAARIESESNGKIQVGRHIRGATTPNANFASTTQWIFDGAGIPIPDLSEDAFFIEAEDFNFDRGQHQSEADTMPYLGGAYEGLAGRDRIDFHQTDNNTSSDLYRTGEGPGVNVNIYALNQLDRGTYLATVNYKVGFNDPDDWYNYTREIPTGGMPAYFFARLASGQRANAVQLDLITGRASTTSQSLDKIGEIRGNASGDYNRFLFVPLRDEAGELIPLEWSGETTFRITILEGGNEDMDYFVLAPAVSSGPAQVVEVMGQDRGGSPAGFANNFEVSNFTLTPGSQVRLVDLVDNAPGSEPEALYAEQIIVPAGAQLDLNGLSIYVHSATIDPDGELVNGTVTEVQEEAPLLQIVRHDASVELRWPVSAVGFKLVFTPDLAPPVEWQDVSAPPTTSGSDNVVTESLNPTTRYYRLQLE